MKKSLVLAMAMALGITTSAYAANPFSDVPAGHWAYDSIAKLADAGIIEGYGDTTFGGDRLMTRYEMAQIVAKAMARGANVDRLAAEFADELDTLGVRVANLEKRTDNVKIAGQIRTSYADYSRGAGRLAKKVFGKTSSAVMRSRLFISGEINDNWTYTGTLQNIQNYSNDTGDEKTEFQRAYVEGKYGNVKFTLGRYHSFVADGNLYDHRIDGAKVTVGREWKGEAEYGKLSYADGSSLGDDFYRFTLTGKTGAWDWEANYLNIHNLKRLPGNDKDDRIWTLGTKAHFGKGYASAMYLKSNVEVEGQDDGYVFGLGYGGAKPNAVNSWGIWTKHYRQPGSADIMHTIAALHPDTGFKGWGFGADYTLAKNMIFDMEYYALKDQKKDSDEKFNTWWTHLMILF